MEQYHAGSQLRAGLGERPVRSALSHVPASDCDEYEPDEDEARRQREQHGATCAPRRRYFPW